MTSERLYAQVATRTFDERRKAEAWGKEQKLKYKQGEVGVAKIDIDFNERMGGQWIARILLPQD